MPNFASPDTAPGTRIRFNKSQSDREDWADCIMVGTNPRNSATLLVKDMKGKEWAVHWAYTRLPEGHKPDTLETIHSVIRGNLDMFKAGDMSEEAFLKHTSQYVVALLKVAIQPDGAERLGLK